MPNALHNYTAVSKVVSCVYGHIHVASESVRTCIHSLSYICFLNLTKFMFSIYAIGDVYLLLRDVILVSINSDIQH